MPVPSGRNFTGPITVVMSVAAIASRSLSRSAPARGLARLRPRRGHLVAPVGLLLEDRDRLRPFAGGDERQQPLGVLADVRRFPERGEEVLETLLVDLVQRKGDAEIGRLVLLRDR